MDISSYDGGDNIFATIICHSNLIATGIYRLFPNTKQAEDGVEQVFRRRFATPAVQELSRIKRATAL
jgi:hypothetical protein